MSPSYPHAPALSSSVSHFILEILITILLRLFFVFCPYFEPLSSYQTVMWMSNEDMNMRFFEEMILGLADKITIRYVAAYLGFLCVCVFLCLWQRGRGRLFEYYIQSVHDRNITKLDVSNPSGI